MKRYHGSRTIDGLSLIIVGCLAVGSVNKREPKLLEGLASLYSRKIVLYVATCNLALRYLSLLRSVRRRHGNYD